MNSPKELTLPKGSKVKIDGIPYWLKQATVVTGFSEPTMPVSGKNNDTSASVYETSKTLATIAALCAARLGDLTQPPNVRHYPQRQNKQC